MDRKARIREYREACRPAGVYRIRNTTSGRWLLGSSADVPSMLNRHRAQMRLGAHRNRALQHDWNTLGADSFVFETLDLLEPKEDPGYDPAEELAVLEAMWRERLGAGESGSDYGAK